MNERWAFIEEFNENYQVSNLGRVRSCLMRGSRYSKKLSRFTILNPTPHYKSHYLSVMLSNNGRQARRNVHRLVLIAFKGCGSKGSQARHLDGIKANNHLNNLAWGTAFQNSQDKITHGTSGLGEANAAAKLTESKVLKIRIELKSGIAQWRIAEKFNVCPMTICLIGLRRIWRHI